MNDVDAFWDAAIAAAKSMLNNPLYRAMLAFERAERIAQLTEEAREETDGTEDQDMPKGRDGAATELLEITDTLLDEIEAVLDETKLEEQPLTLADLMREGALMAPQAIGKFKTPEGDSCALQAAYDAAKARGLVS